MIRIPKTIGFNFPGAAYVDWTITANSTCVTLDKTSGRSTSGVFNIAVNAQFTDSACITGTILTATGTDNKGCITTIPVTFANPCTSLAATINPGGDLTAVATISGGIAPYTIVWNYDGSRFSASSVTNPSIQLTALTSSVNVITTPVYVQVTDVNGCSVTTSYNLAVPQISFPNVFNSVASCLNNVITWTLYIDNYTLFDRTFVDVLNPDITAEWQSNGFIKFSIPNVDYDFQHDLQLKALTGQLTSVAKVNVTTNLCTPTVIPLLRVDGIIGAGTSGGTQTYAVVDNGTINYNTFQFVPTSGQSVASGVLTTALGVAELLPTREILYTAGSIGFDRVRFRAEDFDGNLSEHVDLFIDPYNYPTPTATNFSLNGSVGQLITDDLSARFSSPIRSVEIVTAPTKGSLSIEGTTLQYLATSSGADTLVLKGIGLNDVESANLTVSFSNVSSGTSIPGTVCTGGTIDLTSLLADYSVGGTWSQLTGTAVSLAVPSAVSFASAPSGFYTFNYVVGTSSTDVTVEHRIYTRGTSTVQYLLPSGNDPNIFRITIPSCSSDVTIDNIYVKIFRAVAPSLPTDPANYYETVPFNSLTAGTAICDYSHICTIYNYLAKVYVNGICGEQSFDLTIGGFACS